MVGSNKELELDLGGTPGSKTTQVVSPVTGEPITSDLLAYHDLLRIVMAVEDDASLRKDMGDALFARILPPDYNTEVQTSNKKLLEQGKLISNQGVGLAVVHSQVAALEILANVARYSPQIPYGTFFLDLNMGGNLSTDEGGKPGERMPTDALFLKSQRTDVFHQFLNSGGQVIEYTGMPDQLMQSEHLLNLERAYPYVTLLVGTKSKINLGDLVEFVSRLPDEPRRCRTYVERFRTERETKMNGYAQRIRAKPEASWSEIERTNMAVIKNYQANPWIKYDLLPLVEAMKQRDRKS